MSFLIANVNPQLPIINTNANNIVHASNIIVNTNVTPPMAKQGQTKKASANRKNGIFLQTTTNQQQPQQQQQLQQQQQQQQQQTQPPPQQQIISASSNDFKSKKISSILKSGIFMNTSNMNANTNALTNHVNQSNPVMSTSLFKQPPLQHHTTPNTIYTQTLQLNPIQLTLDTNTSTINSNVGNNSNNSMSIPLYSNSLNDQFLNTFSVQAHNNNSSLIDYSNHVAFNYPNSANNNANSNVITNYNGLTLKQIQAEKIKDLKTGANSSSKKQNTESPTSQKASIDNTIDSILNMVTGNSTGLGNTKKN